MAEDRINHAKQEPAKKKTSVLKVTLIILGLLIALLILKFILIITASPTISVDYLDEYSKITCPEDYDPNENAAPYYNKVFDTLCGMSELVISCRQVWPGDMNDTELDIVKSWLAVNSKALGYLKEAVSKPYYWVQRSSSWWSQGMYSLDLSQEVNNFRTAAYTLDLEAKLLANQGQLNSALEHVIYIYRMGSHLHRLQGSIEEFVGISFKTIAVSNVFTTLNRQKLDAKMLEHFQKELEREISKNRIVLDFQGEKLGVYDFIQRVFTDNGRGDGNLIPRKAYELIEPTYISGVSPSENDMERWHRYRYFKALWAGIIGPDRRKTVQIVDKYFSYVDTLKYQTPWQLHSKGIDSNNRYHDMLKGYFISQCVPTIGFFYHRIENFQRQKTEESALIATISILRYKEEKGQLPENLDFAALLNFATLPFYWWNYERQRGKPDDARTEELVRWCKAHNVTTKGHPLAWNWGEQKWLPDEPEAAMRAQFKRIERCVRRFKNDIDIWDVVNEATHYDRSHAKQNAPKLTEAIRRMGVGAYVREAFKAARRANPKATLLINDYRTDPAYADKVISQLVDDSGQPLYDVIGIQSHMHGGCWPVENTWDVCQSFAKFGKPLHYTETTVVSGPRTSKGWNTTPEGEKRQAEKVPEFYTVLFSHPAVEAITWWDFTDQGAWQRAPAGFLRADMTPKPAYEQLERLIKDKWWTQTKLTLAAGGKARFRGFFGQYKVTARSNGRRLTGTFSFDKSTKEPIDVKLS